MSRSPCRTCWPTAAQPDGSDGSVCKLYEDAGANIGATAIAACTQGLVCTPLQVWHLSLMSLLLS